jgi:hypothetical protein
MIVLSFNIESVNPFEDIREGKLDYYCVLIPTTPLEYPKYLN